MGSREPTPAMNHAREVAVFPTAADLARAVADEFASQGRECVARSGRFTVALAGGNTPRQAYELIPTDLPWDKFHVFFGDERPVPPDDAASNYRMARESLLSRVPIPDSNVHRICAELEPETAAQLYEDQLRECFPGEVIPRFDLVLLGMGTDGHTASLFPETGALRERKRLVVANWVEKLNQSRITLTIPVLNAATRVVFLVAGDDKATVLKRVLRDPSGEQYPVQFIRPGSGSVKWMLDSQAARLIEGFGPGAVTQRN